jgi:putative endopeptidase
VPNFRQRLAQNTWLTAPTRDYALEKLGKIKIVVGYPDKWIDYSSVDVKRLTITFGDVTRLNEFRGAPLAGTPWPATGTRRLLRPRGFFAELS